MRSDGIIYSVYSFCSVCCFAMLGMYYTLLNGEREVGRESEPPSITSVNPKIFKKYFNLSKNLHDIY